MMKITFLSPLCLCLSLCSPAHTGTQGSVVEGTEQQSYLVTRGMPFSQQMLYCLFTVLVTQNKSIGDN